MAFRHIDIFLHIICYIRDSAGKLALSVELRLLCLTVIIVRHLVIFNDIAHLDRFRFSIILTHHQNRIVLCVQLLYLIRVQDGIHVLYLNMIRKIRIPVNKARNSVIHRRWICHHVNRYVLIEGCEKRLRRISHRINLCTAQIPLAYLFRKTAYDHI